MTNQVEVKEQIRWEDLEIVEEPRYFEGLGDTAAQIHQALCGEITEWEEGNEPVPTFQQSLKDLSEYDNGYDPAKVGADITRGILVVSGISVEEFTQTMEGRARAALEMEMDYLNTPVLGAVDWREANKRLPKISEMVARINAFCTPIRINLTGEWGIPNDE